MHVEEFLAIVLFVVVFFATVGEFVAWLLFSLFLLIGVVVTKIIDLFVKVPDEEVEFFDR